MRGVENLYSPVEHYNGKQVVIAGTYNQETSLQSQELQASRQQSQELQSIVTIAEIVIAIYRLQSQEFWSTDLISN